VFIGHIAVGFASKALAPRTSLGVLIAAPVFADLIWPIFLSLGWEHVRIDPGNTAFTPLDFVDYPISHSLITSVGWGLLFGAVYWAVTRYTHGAVVAALGVVSHWVLDFVTHGPDMPLYPGGPRVGLGLWDSVAGTIAVESVMWGFGLWIYLRQTRALDRTGTYAFWFFVALLLLIYGLNAQGQPPPSVGALIITAYAGWMIPMWAWWIDRHRKVREAG